MELDKLLKERDAYAGKIFKLGIIIAVIFLFPAIIAIVLSKFFGISQILLFGIAFVVSWSSVFFLYKKINKQVTELDQRIAQLRKQEDDNNQHTT